MPKQRRRRAKKAARRVTARAKRERERPAKLAARWAEPSEQSQSDLDKNLAKLRSIDESDFPIGEKDRIVALWEKAVAEADDDAPKTKREKRETVPRPDPTPDRATAEQIAHIKRAVHGPSRLVRRGRGPRPRPQPLCLNEADTRLCSKLCTGRNKEAYRCPQASPALWPPERSEARGSTGRD